MKVIENVTIYKCDFCKKELKRQYAMQNHEKNCTKNPVNFRPCLKGCIHLERREVSWDNGTLNYYTGETNYNFGQAFYCVFHKKFVLHPKVENEIGLKNIWFGDSEVTQEEMPKKCEEFDDNIIF